MVIFEWIVALLAGSLVLAALARRLTVPYPTLLALGGAALALIPSVPMIELDPALALVLFVSPILLDSGFDTSLRDVKDNWSSIGALVLGAVGITTVAVAVAAHLLVPGLPWAAAIALGAIVAPPDAAAATAVLKQVRPPQRIMTVLEGESLLNDASALLIYRVAVEAAMGSEHGLGRAIGVSTLGIVGSLVAGPALAWLTFKVTRHIKDISSSIIAQFVITFGVWLLAEHLHLSAVLTVVTYAVYLGRVAPAIMPARQRIPSFAVWETGVFLLNVLAFVLVGLQLDPILKRLDPSQRGAYLGIAAVILLVVVGVRFAWVMGYDAVVRLRGDRHNEGCPRPLPPPTTKGGLVVSWCGMRGIVTLAAAFALPAQFPFRDLLVLCAFAVVLGTLVLQGLTLPTLLRKLDLQDDDPVAREAREARLAGYHAALASIEGDESEAARALRWQITDELSRVERDQHEPSVLDDLRRRAGHAARSAVLDLRDKGIIGDTAFQRVEEELDRMEMTTEEH